MCEGKGDEIRARLREPCTDGGRNALGAVVKQSTTLLHAWSLVRPPGQPLLVTLPFCAPDAVVLAASARIRMRLCCVACPRVGSPAGCVLAWAARRHLILATSQCNAANQPVLIASNVSFLL